MYPLIFHNVKDKLKFHNESLDIVNFLKDPHSDLSIIFVNKYDMHAKALRLIKRICMHYNYDWAHKNLLDMAIYTNSSGDTVLNFY